MSGAPAVSFTSIDSGIAALALAACIVAIARGRKIPLPHISAWLFAAGILLLAVAASGPAWFATRPGKVAIMVDLSPSTRGAHFRDAHWLQQRISQLVGDLPCQTIAFAAQNRPLDLAAPIREIPADRTTFSPPPADAIVLFSDARFELPQKCPPVYVVMDDGLEAVKDASVRKLELRGQSLAATIANTGAPRQAAFPDSTATVGKGTFVVTRPAPQDAPLPTVRLNPADLWPENDSMSVNILPPAASEKWWIGQNPPDTDWRTFTPNHLPQLPQQYLSPAVIVIDNQSAQDFSPGGLDRLTQYVRDLGGSLLIAGGENAFGAGGYGGTPLEQLSPLASFPPTPTTRWILLADGSGSMSQQSGATSRWAMATSAIVKLLPGLPPPDPVQIGQFSQDVTWWLPPEPAADAAKASLPPKDAYPHGPTNLEAALNQIADESDGQVRTELILLSDCDATIAHPDILMDVLVKKQIRLHVLAIAEGSALQIIRGICQGTGGQIIEETDPKKWAQSLRIISQAALPPLVTHAPVVVRFENAAQSIAPAQTSVWDRTWIKPDADWWAESELGQPMAAFWRVGTGCVLATGFEPDGSTVESLVSLIAQKPRDPRFTVRWQTDSGPHLIVDASDHGKFLNGLSLSLEVAGADGTQTRQLQQTGPGRYETSLDFTRDSRIATLRMDSETIDRSAIAGRYPPEFDALGNDHETMRKLANQTGGAVIWPGAPGPIDFHWPRAKTPLGGWFGAAGAMLIGCGIVTWMNRMRA